MPTTSKMVHFDDNLERVRHFLHSEKPNAVSAHTSPTEERPKFHWGTDSDESESEEEEEEDPRLGFQRYLDRTEWHISLPNFKPAEHNDHEVYVESIFLSTDKNTLLGHIAVKNIAFEKYVNIKYSIDDWKTVTVVAAEYNDDVRRKRRQQGYDRFTFAINMGDFPQHAIKTKSIFFCVGYWTNGQEFWDNNNGRNYQVDFTRVTKVKSSPVRPQTSSRLPARHHQRSKSAGTSPVSSSVSSSSGYAFGLGPAKATLGLDETDLFGTLPRIRTSPTRDNQFTSRYDFGAASSKPGGTAPAATTHLATANTLKGAVEDKLALNAKSYQELIDSYCFFGGKADKPKKAGTAPVTTAPGPSVVVASSPSPARLFDPQPDHHEWKKGPGVSV